MFSTYKKRLKDYISNHPVISSVVINSAFLLITMNFCEVKYETSDDFIMSAIISGVYGGVHDPHLMFINVLWGYLLLPFYYLVPSINWYLVSLLFVSLMSFTAMTYIVLKQNGVKTGLFFAFFIFVFLGTDSYIMFQFTKTAATAVMAGSLLFINALRNVNKFNKKELICGGILAVVGTMIRFNASYVAGGFILLILVYGAIRFKREGISFSKKHILKVVTSGAVLIAIVFSLKAADSFIYSSNDDYKFYKEYNHVRGLILDRPSYDYSVLKDRYEEAGLSENDYFLLRTWNFGDSDFYTLDRMEDVVDILNENQSKLRLSPYYIKDALCDRGYTSYPIIWASILLLIVTLIFINICWLFPVASVGLGTAYILLFAALGKMVYRVEYSVILCSIFAILYMWRKEDFIFVDNDKHVRKVFSVFAICLLVFVSPVFLMAKQGKKLQNEEYTHFIQDKFYESWYYDYNRLRTATVNDNAYKALKDEIISNQDNYYFISFNTAVQVLYFGDNPFINNFDKYPSNASFFSGVTVNFPLLIDNLSKNGIDNPMKSLADNNVYLIDNIYQEYIFEFIKEHYYPDAKMSLYKNLDGFNIWKISAE